MQDIPSGLDAGKPQTVTFEALLPPDMARRAEEAGVQKAATDNLNLLVLSVLGGAFVSFGAIFATTVTAGAISAATTDGAATLSAALPYGVMRLLSGLVFTVGLILVIVGGAELFTGNTMIVMAWANKKVTSRALLQNWAIAFAGNFAGAFLTAGLMFYSTQYTFGGGAVGLNALATANFKTTLEFVPALALGIMCNVLVCLAVWMCYGARSFLDKIATIVPPIAAFAAAGFEHCIANIYFFSMALFIKAGAPDSFWASIGRKPSDFPALTWENFLVGNLLPVTVGNIIGGSVMVAAIYWFIYLRRPTSDAG